MQSNVLPNKKSSFCVFLTLLTMDIFEAAHRWGAMPPFPKICHTYPTMMKRGTVIPYLKKIQRIYDSRYTPPDFCWYQHFFTGNQQILLYSVKFNNLGLALGLKLKVRKFWGPFCLRPSRPNSWIGLRKCGQ